MKIARRLPRINWRHSAEVVVYCAITKKTPSIGSWTENDKKDYQIRWVWFGLPIAPNHWMLVCARRRREGSIARLLWQIR
jgi:hypothetical protein